MLFSDIKIIDKDFQAQEHMYVRTEGAFISYIGKEKPEEIRGEEIYNGKNKVLVPAFFNTHCHVPMTLLRGYGGGLPLQRWLNEKIFPFEAKLTRQDIKNGTALGAMELLASGTASITDMYFKITDMADTLYEAGMKANICNGIVSFNPAEKIMDNNATIEILDLREKVLSGAYGSADPMQKGSRIIADMGLHAEYTTHESIVREAAAMAKEKGLAVHVHVSETKSEHEECKARHNGLTPVQYFEHCGVFENRVQAAHCVYIEDADVEIMKAHGAYMAHNASSNLKLGSGIAPVALRVRQGLNVNIGTDGASSNNNLDMMEELHLAALLARGASCDANAISASDMLRMATYVGAMAQGRTDCGRIEEGCRADMFVLDIDRPHLQPDFDTLENIVFAAQSSDVVLTMVDGDVVYKNGEFRYLDHEKVIYEADRSFRRILSEL